MKATMGERGQVTIPKPVRDRLGLRAGQRLEVTDEAGRIVLVKVPDDDPVMRSVIATIVREVTGTEVIQCSSGKEAWDAWSTILGIEGVVTDWDMPDMDGLDLAERIHARNPDFPIILITGRLAEFDWNRMLDCGVRQLLSKPFTCESLTKAVKQCLLMASLLAAA